jgi:putative hydrolase of the HAD superfamily
LSERGVLLWDFDGTLAERPGLWGACLIEVLDERMPGHGLSADDVRPFLRDGFPWHEHDTPHPELSVSSDAWWSALEPLLARAYESVGVAEATECARAVRASYTAHGWRLFDDTLPVLGGLRADGWRHVVLSNHVPELGDIVAALGLDSFVERVITSAATGYEKPHPEAFRRALTAAGEPQTVWMLGDNPVADVAGAEALGIPAILVRGPDGCDLYEAADLVQRS